MRISIRTSLLLLSLLVSGFSSLGQTNFVSADVLVFFRHRIGISYERSFKKKFSIRSSYENERYYAGSLNGQTVYELKGGGIIQEFRFYPFNNRKPAPLGFYFGPSFRYIFVKENYTDKFYGLGDTESTGRVFNYSMVTGYKFNIRRVAIEFLTGYGWGQVYGLDDQDGGSMKSFYTDGMVNDLKGNFRLEVSLGYYFPKMKD